MFHRKVETMEIADILRREFSFITGNYRILLISWVIMDLAMEMPVPNYQLYVQDVLGGKDFPMALGIIGLANFLAMAAVAFPGGYLADKYGRRWLIITMTFGIAFSYLFFAFAPTWHFILTGTIVHSLCLIYQPALFAMIQDSLPPERRGMGVLTYTAHSWHLQHSRTCNRRFSLAGVWARMEHESHLLDCDCSLSCCSSVAIKIKRNDNEHGTNSLQIFYLFIPEGHQREFQCVEGRATINAMAAYRSDSCDVWHCAYQRDQLDIRGERAWNTRGTMMARLHTALIKYGLGFYSCWQNG